MIPDVAGMGGVNPRILKSKTKSKSSLEGYIVDETQLERELGSWKLTVRLRAHSTQGSSGARNHAHSTQHTREPSTEPDYRLQLLRWSSGFFQGLPVLTQNRMRTDVYTPLPEAP